jgi:hypothetical protein
MDRQEKSFEVAGETSKLLITLSTGIIAFCVTLINPEKDKLTSLVPITLWQKSLLGISWLILLLCTGAGIWVQLSVIHVLSQAKDSEPTVWDKKVTVPYCLQLALFMAGMILLVVYGGWRQFR